MSLFDLYKKIDSGIFLIIETSFVTGRVRTAYYVYFITSCRVDSTNVLYQCYIKSTALVKSGLEVCQPAACPILSATTNLPMNRFFVTITEGKCKCVAPQTCDA